MKTECKEVGEGRSKTEEVEALSRATDRKHEVVGPKGLLDVAVVLLFIDDGIIKGKMKEVNVLTMSIEE